MTKVEKILKRERRSNESSGKSKAIEIAKI